MSAEVKQKSATGIVPIALFLTLVVAKIIVGAQK